MSSFNTNIFKVADFLFYRIGANPVPTDTKYKRINIRWRECQDKSIQVKGYESKNEKGEYDKEIAVRIARLHRDKNE
jgi:hypothetical protein